MYNLNEVNCGPGPEYGKLTITQGNCTATPKTPEIINSLMAISPLEEYMKRNSTIADDKLFSPNDFTSADTCSSGSSNVDSPTSPISAQSMRSQLIKEDLKLRLQKKRQNNLSTSDGDSVSTNQMPAYCSLSGCDESSMDTEEDDGNSLYGDANLMGLGLTPEDEERRRRRRERNKIAATKCRLKKRERTNNLVQESQELETQNLDLKSQIEELRLVKRNLVDMLNVHKPICVKPSPEQSPVLDFQQPPSFMPPCISTASADVPFAKSASKERLSSTDTSILPDLCQIDAFDFQESFVKNPAVMLSASDNVCYEDDRKNKKDTHLSRKSLLDSNYKSSIPNFTFLDDTNTNHYDMSSFMDNSETGCMV